MAQKSFTTWKSSAGFIWSMIGSAVGFANILSFSAQCYKNGGGAFLVPYIAAILLLGLPMLILEGAIGHRKGLPIVAAFGQEAGRLGRTFAWLSVIACATIGAFYVVLTGYSVAYAYFAGAGSIPSDTASFFRDTFLHDTGNLAQFGTLSLPVLGATLAVCFVSWIILARNIRSGVERICSIFLPMLFGITSLLAIAALFLPGATEGIRQFLTPHWQQLANPALWRDVFGQVFFSYSLGLGIVTGYARYADKTTSIPRAMAWVAIGDLVISLIAGLAIFCCMGYLSHTTGAPFSEIVRSDSTFEIGFVIFPKILQALGIWGQPLGVIFFFCVFIAGITGVFSIMESIMGNLQVEFRRSRAAAATITTAAMTAGAVLFCFGNGQMLLSALAPMVLGNNYLIGGLAEIAVFMYVSKSLRDDPVWMRGNRRRPSFYLLLVAIPAILAIILVSSASQELRQGFALSEFIRWGWLAAAIGLAFLLSRRGTAQEEKLQAA
jgi:neurotransmitter:Na+ symporter, NSS family